MRQRIIGLFILACFGLIINTTAAFPQTGAGKPVVKQGTAPQTDVSSGPEMFKAYCAACHGPNAKGNGPAAAALKKAPSDLTVLAKNNGGKFPEERFRELVERNAQVIEHGTLDMPLWGPVFRSLRGGEDGAKLRVFNLMKYVETLQGH
jgi:mono/diheme cytochrome c family protein